MTFLANAMSDASLLAALELQLEWGVETVTENFPWNPVEESSPSENRLKWQERKTEPLYGKRVSTPLPSAAAKNSSDMGEVTDNKSLIHFINQFKDIPLARTATHYLMPEWHENARFTIIGEIPDADEDRSGNAFSGEAGFYLDKVIQSLGLKRDEINFISSIPWRPPGGRPLLHHELEVAAQIVKKALTLSRSLPVVTMGTTPLRLLKGKATHITKARGKWHNFILPEQHDKIQFLATYHPLQLKAGAVVRRGLWQDMLLLLKQINNA